MNRANKLRLLWAGLAVGSMAVAGVGLYVQSKASGLFLHASGRDWQGIAVICSPGNGTQSPYSLVPVFALHPPFQEVRVPTLLHRPRELWVRFADGGAVRVAFSGSVVGTFRRTDIYLEPNGVKDSVHLRAVVDRRVTTFSGDIIGSGRGVPLPPVQARL